MLHFTFRSFLVYLGVICHESSVSVFVQRDQYMLRVFDSDDLHQLADSDRAEGSYQQEIHADWGYVFREDPSARRRKESTRRSLVKARHMYESSRQNLYCSLQGQSYVKRTYRTLRENEVQRERFGRQAADVRRQNMTSIAMQNIRCKIDSIENCKCARRSRGTDI